MAFRTRLWIGSWPKELTTNASQLTAGNRPFVVNSQKCEAAGRS